MHESNTELSDAQIPKRFPSFFRGLLMAGVMVTLLVALVWIWRTWDPQAFNEWRREAGPIPFFAALALLPGIGFPTTPFYILAGATFSPMTNLLGVSISLATHVALSYWVAHSWMRRLLERLLRRTGHQLPVLEKGSALRFALLVKMAPGVPTFLKTYMIGMSGISFPAHFIVCFGVTACYAAAFVVLGESLAARDAGTGVIGVILLLIIVAILYWVRRRLKRASASTRSAEQPEAAEVLPGRSSN